MADPRLHRDPGAPACGREKSGRSDAAPGRSLGGFGTELHVAVDGLGSPVGFVVAAGQEADVTHAEALRADHEHGAVIAYKGYDSDKFVGALAARGAEMLIPPLKRRKQPRRYDKHPCEGWNLTERLVARLKQYGRVATRYDKTARDFPAFVHLAHIMALLRRLSKRPGPRSRGGGRRAGSSR